MSKYLWVLDFGHGGIIDGRYVTAPRKMHVFPDGLIVHEGVINRQIGRKLSDMLKASNIDCMTVSDSEEDMPLMERVEEINEIFGWDRNTIVVSIHSNAGGGSGFEIFTSRGQTKSDKIAEIFAKVYKDHFPTKKFRSDLVDGDSDKEADFTILKETKCPAVLVENLFFDNRAEAEFLISQKGQTKIAECLLDCILDVEDSLL